MVLKKHIGDVTETSSIFYTDYVINTFNTFTSASMYSFNLIAASLVNTMYQHFELMWDMTVYFLCANGL